MTLNEKPQNYEVVDLVESYNSHIKVISIQRRIKEIRFFKWEQHVAPHCTAAQCCGAIISGAASFLISEITYQTTADYFGQCLRGTYCGATAPQRSTAAPRVVAPQKGLYGANSFGEGSFLQFL